MERIQRKRTKGWKMPANSKYVGRPGKWGNPYVVGTLLGDIPIWIVRKAGYWLEPSETPICAETAKNLYEVWIRDKTMGSSEFNTLDLSELAGFDYLACWCPLDQPCHVDILLELLTKLRRGE